MKAKTIFLHTFLTITLYGNNSKIHNKNAFKRDDKEHHPVFFTFFKVPIISTHFSTTFIL